MGQAKSALLVRLGAELGKLVDCRSDHVGGRMNDPASVARLHDLCTGGDDFHRLCMLAGHEVARL
eukprot:scaffold2380_cov102-Isochrysis_galbana.AAC.4